jgi:hypothetical protein
MMLRPNPRYPQNDFRARELIKDIGEKPMKTRKRWLVVMASALLLLALVALPRIIEAARQLDQG